MVSVKEAANILMVSPKTVYNYCHGLVRKTEAQLPKLQCVSCKSGYTYITKKSIDAWIEARHPGVVFTTWNLVEERLKKHQAEAAAIQAQQRSQQQKDS